MTFIDWATSGKGTFTQSTVVSVFGMNESENKKKTGENSAPVKVGYILTAAVILLWTGLAYWGHCETVAAGEVCQKNFYWFLQSRPNEMGDTLAGFAGTLAFLWIIITVLMQKRELKLQREEVKKTNCAFDVQNKFIGEQTKLLKQQQEDRQQLELMTEFNLLSEELFNYLKSEPNQVKGGYVNRKGATELNKFVQLFSTFKLAEDKFLSHGATLLQVSSLLKKAMKLCEAQINPVTGGKRIFIDSDCQENIERTLDITSSILVIGEQLKAGKKEQFLRSGISEINAIYDQFHLWLES